MSGHCRGTRTRLTTGDGVCRAREFDWGSNKEFMKHQVQDIQSGVFRVVAETFPEHGQPLSPATLVKRDLGADSMQLISLMIALDAEFDAEFAVENIPTEDVTLEWVCQFVHDTLLSSSSNA